MSRVAYICEPQLETGRRNTFSTCLVEACSMVVYISNRTDRCSRAAAGTRQRMLVRPVAIRRNPGFDVFNVRLLIGLDRLLREKRRYQGDLSASINDALLAVNLNTVKLVTLQGKKKQTARETQVVLLRRLIRRVKRIADARGCSINQLVNSGLMAFYSKQGSHKGVVHLHRRPGLERRPDSGANGTRRPGGSSGHSSRVV